MKAADVRKKFLDYFHKHNHEVVSSSSLLPDGDNTLLFTNAGMNQFKNTFLGIEKRPYVRAVTSQKCVRAGGKHNDLDSVGHTARHHTFFEMLGNFSFGDYFKNDAIRFAWEFLTKELAIPADRLYVTVFEKDDEAEKIWHTQEKVPMSRIYRLGEKDNFWRMGDTGPCGPCSEIFYDHFPEQGVCDNKEDFIRFCDNDRFVEIWNLVFMQYQEEPKGVLTPLPKPSVDTGGGLERMAAAMQGTNNNYNTDLFLNIISVAEKISGLKYLKEKESTAAMRVLADHARCASFLISDGILPSNDGRGYVLRRILRRAIRYGRKLSAEKSFLPAMCEAVIHEMSVAYPQLSKQKNLILSTVESEEEKFLATLDQGILLLNKAMEQMKSQNKKQLDGANAFKLYDTYGFPIDLTRIICEENSFSVDESGFEQEMEKARSLARSTWKGAAIAADAALLLELAQKVGATQFTGYQQMQEQSKVLAMVNAKDILQEVSAGQQAQIFVDKSCFYAESGGQVGDRGIIFNSNFKAIVNDCTKSLSSFVLHIEVLEGKLKLNDIVQCQVEKSSRRSTMANHSATHLLHSALRKVLGEHITQAGSLVDSVKTRFDFTHSKPLSKEEIQKIEEMVNAEVANANPVQVANMHYKDAIASGAMALFGEKYGDEVRVLKMGEFSTELCGGTHVNNTAEIRLFKIVSESGVSSGVRRIEALTGDMALQYLLKANSETQEARKLAGVKENWMQYMGLDETASFISLSDYLERAKAESKQWQKQFQELQIKSIDYSALAASAKAVADYNVLCVKVEVEDRNLLMQISERLRDKIKNAVVVLLAPAPQGNAVLVAVQASLKEKISAPNVLKVLNSKFGGKGGGRPDFAQGAIAEAASEDQIYKLLQDSLK